MRIILKAQSAYAAGLAALACVALAGCGGGGGGGSTTDDIARAVPVGSGGRSVRLNNYNSWGLTSSADHQNATKLQAALQKLVKREDIVLTDDEAFWHETPGWDGCAPADIKRLNPGTKIYMYYRAAKASFENDWAKPLSSLTGKLNIGNPIYWADIQQNDWWLRDGNGQALVHDTYHFIDFGKPGVKEKYLQTMLARLAGKPVNGVVIDFVPPDLTQVLMGRPRPAAYPTDNDWYTKAFVPFITYVYDGLRSAGYKTAGLCYDYNKRGSTNEGFMRSKIDISIYESWLVHWNGDWLPKNMIAQRISDFRQDPLECWVADFGLRAGISDYELKQTAALAMYYVSIPMSQDKRSYHHYGQLPWHTNWDFNIGLPAEESVRMTDKFFWSRRYTQGLVLFNYEDSGAITFPITRAYRDASGQVYRTSITVPAHTGMILQTAGN